MSKESLIGADLALIAHGLGEDTHKLSGKTLLISGGAGFLGRYFQGAISYLNKHVLEKPCRVLAVDNYITSSPDNSDFYFVDKKNIFEIWGSVVHPLPVNEKIDFIIHAAGLASPVYYRKYPLETIESAVLGAKNLLELARKNNLEAFLLFSSSEIYGDPNPESVPTPETYHGYVSSVGPRACYDESKRLAETISTIYYEQHGIPTKIVRPFNVYGPGMRATDYRVIPTFTARALQGESIPIHGNGKQTRTFCYITDAIVGFLKVLLSGKPGEAYNIGNDTPEINMLDLAQMFVDAVPGARFTTIDYPETYPGGEPQRRCPNLAKAKAHLGYCPTVSLYRGIERFITWAREDAGFMPAQRQSAREGT